MVWASYPRPRSSSNPLHDLRLQGACSRWILRTRTWCSIIQSTHWAQVDTHIGERPGRYIAASNTGRKLKRQRRVTGRNQQRSIVRYEIAIASQTRLASIKNRTVLRCSGVSRPVPIWLVSLVATFLTQRLFVGVNKPPVPRQEYSRKVDGKRLLDVHNDEIVKSRTRS